MDFLGKVNLFHGRVEGGKAIFGSLVLDYPQANGSASSAAAQLMVRPHDLEIHCQPRKEPRCPPPSPASWLPARR